MSNSFFDEILKYAAESDSLYSGSLKNRRALILFMDRNGLLDIAGFPRANMEDIIRLKRTWIPSEDVMCQLKSKLRLWLSAYRRSDQERLDILCNYGSAFLPSTCNTYRDFIESSGMEQRPVSWELLDYLLTVLTGEVTEMTAVRKEHLLSSMKSDLPRRHVDLFISYLDSLTDTDQASHISYRLHSSKGSAAVDAYTFQEFSSMAYCIFNERYWSEYHLLERACKSKVYANLWAFLAFFFISGLRGTDVVRIPRPSLPYEGDKFRQHMLQGRISDPGRFAREIVFRLKYRELSPNKTSAAQNIPHLKLSIPVSIEKPFGIILSVAASYFPEDTAGQPFLKSDCSYRSIRRFFGYPFSELLDRKGFNIRKANKAYLQGIEIIADASKDTFAKGYLIAALARSHKGSLTTLPETTDIYLRDASFSGLNPKLVLFEMFERGIFGFIPHLMLKTCFGEDYQKLSIFSQTDLIAEIGITPCGIENLISASSRAMDEAIIVIREMYEQNMDISEALARIASGEAAAKQDGYLCALTASGQACRFPERRSCMTCKYEICTKAVLHQLTAEYSRLLSNSKKPGDWRSKEIISKAILPVIQEYLQSILIMYPNADLTPYHQLLKGGLEHYDRFISIDR